MLRTHAYIGKLILLVVACNAYFISYADESTNFIHLSAEVGRQQTTATNVIEDSVGYLWLNSHMGILRFDGYDYRPYSFSEIFGKEALPSSILGIRKDSKGDIWCVSKKVLFLNSCHPESLFFSLQV